MHLVLDTRWIFERLSGIGVHTRELVRHLPAHLAADTRITLLFETEALRERLAAETKHPFDTAVLPYGPNSPANQRRLPAALRELQADLYHGTNYMVPLLGRMPRTIVTVHDLIPLMVPNYAPRSKKSKIPFVFPMVLKRCVRRADAVVAVSEHTRQDIIKATSTNPDNVHTIYNGVLEHFAPAPGLTGPNDHPVILYVGRRDPYKNLLLLIDAFAELLHSHPQAQFHIVGPPDERYPEPEQRVSERDLRHAVHFKGAVSDAELLLSYQQATLLAFPSAYEGFGLPVLEAMACGTPVVCTTSSSLPEIAGDAALTIPAGNQAALTQAMTKLVEDKNLRKSLSDKGLRQSKEFSWAETARKHAVLYTKPLS